MNITEADCIALIAASEKATPGPWAHGTHWRCAGTHPPVDPNRPTCAYCEDNEPAEVVPYTAEEIAGGRNPSGAWHRHAEKEPLPAPDEGEESTYHDHRVEDARGITIAGNYDYDCGGIVKKADAALIVMARNMAKPLAESLIARTREVEMLRGLLQRAKTLIPRNYRMRDEIDEALGAVAGAAKETKETP